MYIRMSKYHEKKTLVNVMVLSGNNPLPKPMLTKSMTKTVKKCNAVNNKTKMSRFILNFYLNNRLTWNWKSNVYEMETSSLDTTTSRNLVEHPSILSCRAEIYYFHEYPNYIAKKKTLSRFMVAIFFLWLTRSVRSAVGSL